jgi:hypothetical protein
MVGFFRRRLRRKSRSQEPVLQVQAAGVAQAPSTGRSAFCINDPHHVRNLLSRTLIIRGLLKQCNLSWYLFQSEVTKVRLIVLNKGQV